MVVEALRFAYSGELLTVKEWSIKLNINYVTLKQRLLTYKWPVEKALNLEVRSYKYKKVST